MSIRINFWQGRLIFRASVIPAHNGTFWRVPRGDDVRDDADRSLLCAEANSCELQNSPKQSERGSDDVV